MSILSFFRWTNSRHANDLTVDGFTRVTEQRCTKIEQHRIARAAVIIGKETIPSAEDIDRLGTLLRDA